jgi:hypothetical protein
MLLIKIRILTLCEIQGRHISRIKDLLIPKIRFCLGLTIFETIRESNTKFLFN